MRSRSFVVWGCTATLSLALALSLSLAPAAALDSAAMPDDAAPAAVPDAAPALPWYTDYAEACRAARLSEQLLLIVFHDPHYAEVYDEYLNSLAKSERFAQACDQFVICKLPTDFEVVLPPADDAPEGTEATRLTLLAHPAFAEMGRRPGVVVIDYAHTRGPHYGHVVNIYPFKSRFLAPDRLVAMMNLPEGSLTQRTMVFAVLSHPERPASVQGKFVPELAQESELHSRHQAQIRVQGHHQWESRFHRINARLGRGLVAQEVVAESWPGQDLVDAAEECVHSWRQSSGHWDAVRRRPAVFAFDIKRGANGIWYATGLFGR
jgi:hypothetical protein